MISVIATVRIKQGKLAPFLEVFKANVPHVVKEEGCIEYMPALDMPTGLPGQELDANSVTIIEKWTGVEALRAHLASPHMLSYREKVKDLVDGVSLKVVTPA
jgi:quinol monooxygenase YgiN